MADSPTPKPLPKRPRPADMATETFSQESNQLMQSFQEMASILDAWNTKRDNLNKISRDVTVKSKNAISLLHRMDLSSRDGILHQAKVALRSVRGDLLATLAKQLVGNDIFDYHNTISPGLQEYVEAATFFEFCASERLATLAEVNAALEEDGVVDGEGQPLRVGVLDYLLGVADLTGEIMRMAIAAAGSGHADVASATCVFVRRLYSEFLRLQPGTGGPEIRDLPQKLEVMKASLLKIETVNYQRHIRLSEYLG